MQEDINLSYSEIKDKAEGLIHRLNKLNIIYLRVSTSKQEEIDQLKDILMTFNLKPKDCIIIKAKETAFKIKYQKTRKFNIILDLLKELPQDVKKNCYFWSIDRIYRNRELLQDFYYLAKKTNTSIYSHIEYFINTIADLELPQEVSFMKDNMIDNLISFLGWLAEMESKKRGDRIKKSITKREDGRYYSNKGKLYGKKLKTTKGNNIRDPKKLQKIELFILYHLNKGTSYRKIQKVLAEKGVNVSTWKICDTKKRYDEKMKNNKDL